MRIVILFLIITLCPLLPAFAAEEAKDKQPEPIEVPEADFSELKHTGSDRIDKIIDGLTILMKNGKIVRLASIDIPDFHIWDYAPVSEQALEHLHRLLPENAQVMMYQTRMAKKGRINRMKHQLAHLVIKGEHPVWVQGSLLAHGLARVNHNEDALEMTEQMFKVEQSAREKQRGLWSDDSDWKVLNTAETENQIGDFVVVEAEIKKIASVQNNVYLNFGENWKTDFTVMVTPKVRKKLAHNGIDLQNMAYRNVRVRGWLREYNGPLIELNNPSHIEFLSPDKAENISPVAKEDLKG